jgi:uncharacterized protein with HEPN domain
MHRPQPNVSVPDRQDRDQATLADIARACRLTVEFIAGLDRDAFLDDLKTQAAVLHELTIIGKGVKRLSDTIREANPSVPWRLIAGMRDRLIHQYDAVDLEEVWRTATTDLPALIQDLERVRSAADKPPI